MKEGRITILRSQSIISLFPVYFLLELKFLKGGFQTSNFISRFHAHPLLTVFINTFVKEFEFFWQGAHSDFCPFSHKVGHRGENPGEVPFRTGGLPTVNANLLVILFQQPVMIESEEVLLVTLGDVIGRMCV